MSELDARCLEAFPNWLHTLGDDARALAKLVGDDALPEGARRRLAGALNYLFKSLDLIPDGIEDLGFVDDAFVLRASAVLALEQVAGASHDALLRLAGDAKLIAEFLGGDYERLLAYVRGLDKGTARGRSVDAVLQDAGVRGELVSEVMAWADAYDAPSFARDAKNLVKLRSFLSAKLPS